MFMKKICFLILINLCYFLQAQVSLFVSKKNFHFTTEFYKPLSAWQAKTDSLGLTQENLQLASTAKVSEQWASFIKIANKARIVHQIQLDTKRGPDFFQKYQGPNSEISAIASLFPESQVLFCIDSVWLEARKIPNVYVVSNRMLSESRTIRAAKIYVSVWNLKTKKMQISKSFEWEQHIKTYPQTPISIPENTFLIDRMWSELFNMVYTEWKE